MATRDDRRCAKSARVGSARDAPHAARVNNSRAACLANDRAAAPVANAATTIIRRMRRIALIAILLGVAIAACTPALDWRSVHSADGGVELQFPCKPTSLTRPVAIDGRSVPMTMLSCSAQGLTFGLVDADLGDPARVTPALIAMRAALAANLGAREIDAGPFALPGMTPNPHAVRVRYAGHAPDGAPIEEEAVFFTRAMHVYQAAVLGAHPDEDVVAAFFDNLRFVAS